MKKRFRLIILAVILVAGLVGLGLTFSSDIMIKNDAPSLFFYAEEEHGEWWAIEEFVFSGESWLRIENKDTDKAIFISRDASLEIREALVIVASPDSGESGPYVRFEDSDSGSNWFIESVSPNLKFWGFPSGRILRGNYIILDTGDVDNIPVDGATTEPISSDWAHDIEERVAALESQ